MKILKVYTIGFTKRSAENFFETLRENHIRRLIDIRLNNSSQLAGFAKGKDLKYFLEIILNATYIHMPEFAPTKALLEDYRKKRITWEQYQEIYLELIVSRRIREKYKPDLYSDSCFLCSEFDPDYCHRRLLVEYLADENNWSIVHL